jgi:16S rRNA (guanine(527)-N(7))-methyltransferase RsmG
VNLKDAALAEQLEEFRNALQGHAPTYGVSLTAESLAGLAKYYELLNAWNARLHLVAPTSPSEFATRHILESLLLLKHLPQSAAVADIGSGAGLPIIPCLISRTDIRAVLIEASPKKAVFLREAFRELLNQTPASGQSARVSVVAERFENIAAPEVDFITCRALERFGETVPKLLEWAPARSPLLLFGGEGLRERLEASGVAVSATLIPNSERRFLFRAEGPRVISQT